MLIVAVDFDGTLCENRYPYAGSPNYILLSVLKRLKAKGEIELILWTCRVGEALDYAVNWCKEQGIEFDAVNENLPRIIEQFGGDNRKIFANLYIDDNAVDFSPKILGFNDLENEENYEDEVEKEIWLAHWKRSQENLIENYIKGFYDDQSS